MEDENLEELAKQYFGKEFVSEFEELKQKLRDENTFLRLHGTDKESAEKILKEGLKINQSSVTYTSYPESTYKTMKDWPHNGYKNLVLLGIPYETTKFACLEYDENGEVVGGIEGAESKPLLSLESENEGWHDAYKFPAEFIIGYVDVENKKIIENPLYKTEHTYENVDVIDSELGQRRIEEVSFGTYWLTDLENNDGQVTSKERQNENKKGLAGNEYIEDDWENEM